MRSISIAGALLLLSASMVFSQLHDSLIEVKATGPYTLTKGHGRTTVVFVSGLGEDHTTWNLVQDSVAKFATTISYDRAGLGKSLYYSEDKSLVSLARELQSVIDAKKIRGNIIFVGHSLGCQIIKKYASLYPNKVHGIIFLDPGFDESKLRSRLDDSTWVKRQETLKKYMPPLDAARRAEFEQLNANCKSADEISQVLSMPVVLFTATRVNASFPGSETEFQVKLETHKLWLQTLPNSTGITVPDSRHYIQNDRPDLVVKCIARMVSNLRK